MAIYIMCWWWCLIVPVICSWDIITVSSQRIRIKRNQTRTNTQCSKATVIPSQITTARPFIDNTTLFTKRDAVGEFDPNPPNISCPETVISPYDSTAKNVQTAWYQFKPTTSGYYDFTASIYLIVRWWFGIYEATSCTDVLTTTIGCRQTDVRGVYLTGNKTYYVTVLTLFEYGEDFDFTVSPTTAIRPSNDDCTNAIPIASSVVLPHSVTSNTVITNATIQPNERLPSCDRFVYYSGIRYGGYFEDDIEIREFKDTFGGHSVWYTYTPPSTGYYNFSTFGSLGSYIGDAYKYTVPITLAVYEVSGSSNGNRACSNMQSNLQEVYCSRGHGNGIDHTKALTGGRLYYIQLVPDMYYRPIRQQLILTINRTTSPPINDQCMGAIDINSTVGVRNAPIDVTFATSDALAYPNGFVCNNQVSAELLGSGVWYKYTHTGGINEIEHRLCHRRRGRSYYHMFTGDSCSNLQCVSNFTGSCSDYTPTYSVLKPTTYWFLLTATDSMAADFTVKFNPQSKFRLINAGTDTVIAQLTSSNTLYTYGETYTFSFYREKLDLNIDAYFPPKLNVQSARMTITNPNLTRCEQYRPFSIYGDTDGDYREENIPIGIHHITATPYTQPNCQGPPIKGGAISHSITIRGCDLDFSFRTDKFFNLNPTPLNATAIPCKAYLAVEYKCLFAAQDISIEIYNAMTNTSVSVDDDTYVGNFVYVGTASPNSGIPGPIKLPRSQKYIIRVTIDNVIHPSKSFAISKACIP